MRQPISSISATSSAAIASLFVAAAPAAHAQFHDHFVDDNNLSAAAFVRQISECRLQILVVDATSVSLKSRASPQEAALSGELAADGFISGYEGGTIDFDVCAGELTMMTFNKVSKDATIVFADHETLSISDCETQTVPAWDQLPSTCSGRWVSLGERKTTVDDSFVNSAGSTFQSRFAITDIGGAPPLFKNTYLMAGAVQMLRSGAGHPFKTRLADTIEGMVHGFAQARAAVFSGSVIVDGVDLAAGPWDQVVAANIQVNGSAANQLTTGQVDALSSWLLDELQQATALVSPF
jgi:hypothetical protein